MSSYEFKTTRRIEFADTDMAGIVHFANFFRYMESAEHQFYRSLGLPLHMGGDTAHGWPRVSATCEFHAPLRFGDEIEVHLLVREMRTRSLRYLFFVRNLSGDAPILAARGEMTAVSVRKDPASGKMTAVTIPEAFSAAIVEAPPEVLRSVAATPD